MFAILFAVMDSYEDQKYAMMQTQSAETAAEVIVFKLRQDLLVLLKG